MKLNEDKIKEVCKYVELGMTYKDSALLSGIDESTFYIWKSRGEKESEGLYFEFFKALKRAEQRGKAVLISKVHKASDEQWQAAAWILERRHRAEWSREQQQSIDKPALFLESLQFIAEILHEVDPQGLKVISKNFQVLTSRFKIAVKGENEKSS